MKFKQWNCAVLILLVLVFGMIAGVNYFVDPFGYFTYQSGDYADIDFKSNVTYYQRLLKAKHIQYFGDEYDAYLLGGSKAGSYRAETLSEMDGYRYYNLFELGGNFYEYEMMTEFLLKYGSPQKIVVNISGGEVREYQKNNADLTYKIPAVVKGTSEIKEYIDFLFLDVQESADRIRQQNEDNPFYQLRTDGSRSLQKYYYYLEKNPEQFTQQRVLQNFESHMKRLFTSNPEHNYYQANLDSLKRIKEMCDHADVELLVIVAPSFIGEMSEHESTFYRDYLLNMATITDYWDFSGYHDIDMNPYNFYNEGHFYYDIGDLIAETIAGVNAYPGFGVYVTKENAAAHVAKREADYKKLQQEYEETGTIKLQGIEDASFLADVEKEW